MKYPSVVIEWDNALVSGSARAASGMAILNRQLWDLAGKAEGEAEVVVTYDATEVPEAHVCAQVEQAGGERGWPGRITVAAAPPGAKYYEHKNFGFGLTCNDVVIFLDSDLLPEDGWLEEMIKATESYQVPVAVGHTYLDTDSFYARCMALFWIFEPRSTAQGIHKTGRLVSNNIAFKRALFQRFPFPSQPTFRGQCSELAQILRQNGIPLHANPAAQAAHPPPNGVAHFITRAMFAGYDECRYRGFAEPVGLGLAWSRFRVDLKAVRERVAERRQAIRAGAFTSTAAVGLGAIYYLIKLAAFAVTTFSPTALKRMLTT